MFLKKDKRRVSGKQEYMLIYLHIYTLLYYTGGPVIIEGEGVISTTMSRHLNSHLQHPFVRS